MRWCWVTFQCRGVLLIWIRVGQTPTALAVGAVGCLDIFSLVYHFSFLSPSLWETVRLFSLWIRVGQRHTALALGAVGGGEFGHFFLMSIMSVVSLPFSGLVVGWCDSVG